MVWNPLILTPIHILNYNIGESLFGSAKYVIYELSLFEKFYFLTRRYLIGNFLIALSFSLTSYFITLITLNKLLKKRIN